MEPEAGHQLLSCLHHRSRGVDASGRHRPIDAGEYLTQQVQIAGLRGQGNALGSDPVASIPGLGLHQGGFADAWPTGHCLAGAGQAALNANQ